MSDASQGEGWWIASDGKWYPPQSDETAERPPPPPESKPTGDEQPRPAGNALAGIALAGGNVVGFLAATRWGRKVGPIGVVILGVTVVLVAGASCLLLLAAALMPDPVDGQRTANASKLCHYAIDSTDNVDTSGTTTWVPGETSSVADPDVIIHGQAELDPGDGRGRRVVEYTCDVMFDSSGSGSLRSPPAVIG